MTADKTYEEYRSLAESRLARFREQPLLHFIDGRPTPSANGATFENHSPTDGSSLGAVASGDAIDVDRAARAAQDAAAALETAGDFLGEPVMHRYRLQGNG